MASGQLSAGHARAILAVAGEEGRLKLAQKVIEENLSVRQTENLAPLFSGRENVKVQRQPLPQTYKRAARQLRLALDTTVKVRNIRGKNKIEIEFSDDEELARLVATIYCLLTKDARRKVITAGKKTIFSTKRVLSALDASGVEDHSINLDEHRQSIDCQWSELGY